MNSNRKEIEVKGKKYILTARRSIVFAMTRISPELLKITKSLQKEGDKKLINEEKEDILYRSAETIYDNMPDLFYELIKVAHKDITPEKSYEIYLDFQEEYNDVDENLLKFIYSVFTDSIPREEKKNLNW